MKNKFADVLAENAFNSDTFQKHWKIHTDAFGPILDKAFENDTPSRIHLTAALDFISRRDTEKGIEKLELIKSNCSNDADKAAWLFCMGLAYEMAGDKNKMLACYTESGNYNHRFFLPYLKVAKYAHNDGIFLLAEEYYRRALGCFDSIGLSDQSLTVIASVYTNLCSCLTMMHRYDEAEEALLNSVRILPKFPGRSATEAILYAAMRDSEKVSAAIKELRTEAPAILAQTVKMTSDILSEKHPQFCKLPTEPDMIENFWEWFAQNQAYMLNMLEDNKIDAVVSMITERLFRVFPFMNKIIDIGLELTDNRYLITFADFFVISLSEGLKELITACPEELLIKWNFGIAH